MNTQTRKTLIRGKNTLLLAALAAAALAANVLAKPPPSAGGAKPRAYGPPVYAPLALTNWYPTKYNTQAYSYMEQLPTLDPTKPLETNEMRITFMGSGFPMARRAQAEMSVFVEVGCDTNGLPLDSFIFDLGCGSSENYQSVGIDYARMNKIFINHLHPDHISDLMHVYCFGDGGDRKTPLYVWGNCNSGMTNPANYPVITSPTVVTQNYSSSPRYYNDGVSNCCFHLREAARWATESFAFQTSGWTNWPNPSDLQKMWGLPVVPYPVGDDSYQDANALVPIELDWTKKGDIDPATGQPDNIAYSNLSTGARVTHFPVIHTRRGSMGYKLTWAPPGGGWPLTMIYTSDTKPETNSVWQARNGGLGVDVFIHEMILPPDELTMKSLNMPAPPPPDYPGWSNAVNIATEVENSSHTPQGAFGYLLSQLQPPPKLTVATHFPVSDDTVACALNSVQVHCPFIGTNGQNLVWSFDLMVLRVFPDKIVQCRSQVNEYTFSTIPTVTYPSGSLYAPKYHTSSGAEDPFAQIDQSTAIPATNQDGTVNYRPDGW